MRRAYWLLWTGQVVSRFGDGFFFIAVGWLVYANTGSPLALAVLWFARLAAAALAKTLAAPLVDRFERRRLMVALDLLRALTTVTPWLLALAGALHTWEVYAVLVATGILGTPYMPAAYALLPGVVDRERLLRANAWLEGGLQAMYLLGPAVGGLFIAAFGAPRSMAVDALSYLACAAFVAAIPRAAASAARRREPYGAAVAAGWRLLRGDATLRALTAMQAILGSTDMVVAVLMIPLVRDVLHGGAAGVGLLEASLSAGVIAASLVAHRRMRPLAVWLSVTGFCLATAALVLAPTLAWALVLQVAAGVGSGLFDIRSVALFQAMVGDERLGRTIATRDAVRTASQSASSLVAGAVSLIAGVPGAFAVFGLAGAVLSAGLVARLPGHVLTPLGAGEAASLSER